MFDKAIEIILKHEGGYVNDPDDPGGETKFGITKRNYPTLNIKSLTVE
jgi:lysozyme family protein